MAVMSVLARQGSSGHLEHAGSDGVGEQEKVYLGKEDTHAGAALCRRKESQASYRGPWKETGLVWASVVLGLKLAGPWAWPEHGWSRLGL